MNLLACSKLLFLLTVIIVLKSLIDVVFFFALNSYFSHLVTLFAIYNDFWICELLWINLKFLLVITVSSHLFAHFRSMFCVIRNVDMVHSPQIEKVRLICWLNVNHGRRP